MFLLLLVVLAGSLMAANMKVAILDFAKKDRNSDYVAKSMMKRDFKSVFKGAEGIELIDLKKSQALATSSGFTNLFFAGIEDIKAMGTTLEADIVVWGQVQEQSSTEFKVTAKILSMKSNEVVQVSFTVSKSSKPRMEALKENLLNKISSFSKGEVDKLFGIATQYFNSKNYVEAENSFIELTEIDDQNVDAYFYLGLIKALTKDFEKSVEYYNLGLEINPENIDLLNYLSKSYEELGEIEEAANALIKITEINEDKGVCIRIGNLYATMEYYDEAAEAYNSAIELDAECGEAYRQLALLYFEQEYYDAAIKPFEIATKAFPDDDDLQRKLAKCYNKTGKIESAIAQYKSIIVEQPENEKAYMNLANAYFATEKYNLALETAISLNAITKDNPKSLILLANAYNSLKQYTKAKSNAEAALALDNTLYQPYRIISEISFSRGYIKYEEFLKIEEEAKTVYGEEADRLVEKRDSVKKQANDLFLVSKEKLAEAKARTKSSSELRYIKSRNATLDQLLKATEKGFF